MMNKVIDAMFIGEDGSMGLRHGKFYSVKVSSGYYKVVNIDGKYQLEA